MENTAPSLPAPSNSESMLLTTEATPRGLPTSLPTVAQSMDSLRSQIKELETMVAERERRITELHEALLRQEIRLALHASRFLRERTLLSPELAFKAFGHRFQVKEGSQAKDGVKTRVVVPLGEDGPLRSQRNPGQMADMDEALALFMESDPDMLPLLRATPGGAGTGVTAHGLRVITATDSAAFSRNIDDIAAGRVLVR